MLWFITIHTKRLLTPTREVIDIRNSVCGIMDLREYVRMHGYNAGICCGGREVAPKMHGRGYLAYVAFSGPSNLKYFNPGCLTTQVISLRQSIPFISYFVHPL